MVNENKLPEENSKQDASTLHGIFGERPSLMNEAVEEEEIEEKLEKNMEEESAEPKAEESNDTEKSEEKSEESDEAEDELTSKLKSEKKRRKDAQKWGNEQNQKAAKQEAVLKQLVEDGKLSADDYKDMMTETVAASPFQELTDQYAAEASIVNAFYKRNGEDAVEYATAFDVLAVNEPELITEIMALPAEDRIVGLIEKGKELVDDFKLLQEHGGSVRKAFKAVRAEAVKQAKAEMESGEDPEEIEEKPKAKGRPKIKGTGSKKSKAAKDMSLKGILHK